MKNMENLVQLEKEWADIEAAPEGLPITYQQLNEAIHFAISKGFTKLNLKNVCGQRFIGAGLRGDYHIKINGIPGNDLGIFMDGPTIEVSSNAEDQVGNTMNNGNIIVNGNCGDVVGLSARGGHIYVKNNVGFRVGIHFKQYKKYRPVLIVGGTARDYCGEYMSGGILVLLNRENKSRICGHSLGSGIHGGAIYLRADSIDENLLGLGAKQIDFTDKDRKEIEPYISQFCSYFGIDEKEIWETPFVKIGPESKTPFKGAWCHSLI